MVLVESNLVRIVLETVFSATNRLLSAKLWLNLIIATLTGFSLRDLSFVFGETEIVLSSSASLKSSCSSSIDYPTLLAIAAASRFLKGIFKVFTRWIRSLHTFIGEARLFKTSIGDHFFF